MAFYRYISENPFRLLALGAGANQQQLRQKAAAAVNAAKVGMPPDIGLETIFGGEELTGVADTVRSLTNDATLRTVYRIFWPLVYAYDSTKGGLREFGAAMERFPNERQAPQVRFLLSWYEFLLNPYAPRLRDALDGYAAFLADDYCTNTLTSVLRDEGEFDPESILDAARDAVAEHLMATAAKAAEDEWEAGRATNAVKILAVIRDSTIDPEATARVLRGQTGIGDREMERIRQATEEYGGWTPDKGDADLAAADDLRSLADTLQANVPAAALWQEAAIEHACTVGYAIREYAVDAANEKSDYKAARAALERVLQAPSAQTIHEKIREDLQTLKKLEDDQRQFGGIRPVEQPPTLYTLNGIGTVLYGREPFEGQPGLYFKTEYFCFAFIPLFPLACFLVSDAPGGGWYFHGSKPLERKSFTPVIISVVAICLLFGWLSISPAPSASTDPDSGGSSSAAYDSSTDSGYASATPEVRSRIDALLAESDELARRIEPEAAALKTAQAEMTKQQNEITAAGKRLDADRKTVNRYSKRAVDAYNARLDAYNGSLRKMKTRIKAYNTRVDAIHLLADRVKKIDAELRNLGYQP